MGSVFRKGSSESGQSSALSNTQAQIAGQLNEETTPLRQAFFSDFGNFLGLARRPTFTNVQEPIFDPAQGLLTGYQSVQRQGPDEWVSDPTLAGKLPTALPGNLGLQEQELASAKNYILQNTPRGGLQQRVLAELPLQRLAMRDALRGEVYNTALGATLGQAPVALQGLGSAASNLNNLGAQRIQQNMAFQGGLGSLLGTAIGAGKR